VAVVTVLDAAYWVTCVVLVVSGVTKLGDSSTTDRMLVALGLPAPRNTGRVVGAGEVLIGAAGLMAASGPVATVVAVVVALIYFAFTVVVLLAMRAGLEDCGCIGVRPRRPSWTHVAINAVSATVALAAAVVGPNDLATGLSSLDTGWAGLVGVAVAAGAGALVALPGD
jgi:hypothetical protein